MTDDTKGDYGNGTVFYSPSMGKWVARYPATKLGIGRKVSGYGRTADIAKVNRDKALLRAINGQQRGTANSVKHILERYYQWLDSGNRKGNTLVRKKDRLNRYLEPYMTKPITKLDEAVILAILAKAKANGKNETFSKIPNQLYSEIHQFLDWALKRKIITDNPIRLVEKPSWKSIARETNEQHIDERINLGKELLKFVSLNIDFYSLEYGILLIASLGLRTGEIRGLTWDCFDHLHDDKPCILHIRQQYDRDAKTGEWKLVKWTKTPAGMRKISIPNDWKVNLAYYFKWVNGTKDSFCFTTKNGDPLTSGRLAVRWKKLKIAYEQDRQIREPEYAMTDIDNSMRLYDMRHVTASLLISSGKATIDQVRPILGHMDSRMTEYYTHLTMEAEQRIMNDIPDLMTDPQNFPMWGFQIPHFQS